MPESLLTEREETHKSFTTIFFLLFFIKESRPIGRLFLFMATSFMIEIVIPHIR